MQLVTRKDSFYVPTSKLKSLYELNQLSQLINEPTRVTLTASSLLDQVVTNMPEKLAALEHCIDDIKDWMLSVEKQNF